MAFASISLDRNAPLYLLAGPSTRPPPHNALCHLLENLPAREANEETFQIVEHVEDLQVHETTHCIGETNILVAAATPRGISLFTPEPSKSSWKHLASFVNEAKIGRRTPHSIRCITFVKTDTCLFLAALIQHDRFNDLEVWNVDAALYPRNLKNWHLERAKMNDPGLNDRKVVPYCLILTTLRPFNRGGFRAAPNANSSGFLGINCMESSEA